MSVLFCLNANASNILHSCQHMHFHAGVHATESQGSSKKTRSEVQTNVSPWGPYDAPLKIHHRLQQRRRCCPFVAIERVLFTVSRFLLRDTPSYLTTPLLFRIRSYILPLALRLWDFMRAKAVYAPWISSDLLFSSCSNGNGCHTSTCNASEVIMSRFRSFKRGCKCNNSTL